MARTNESKVRAVLSTTLTSGQINAFIDDASLWVTEELASVTDFTFTTDRLELIERYLAAALCRLQDLGLKSSSINSVSESYQVDPNTTDYLLRAAAFDPTGTIKRVFMPSTDRKPVKFQIGKGFADDTSTGSNNFL